MEHVLNAMPVSFSASAIKEIKNLISKENSENKKLRVGVKGGGCSGMTYVLNFDEMQEDDILYEIEGTEFIMKKSHELYLYGMEINWDDGLNSRGFTFSNPNASKTCGCGTSFSI